MNEFIFLALYGHNTRVGLLVLLLALSVADYFTTIKALKTNPRAKEGNPIARLIFNKFGFNGMGAYKIAGMVGLCMTGIYTQNWILMAVNVIMSYVVYRNFKMIK